MGYEIETRELTPQRIASIRTKTTQAELSETLGQILPEVLNSIQSQSVSPAGPPIALYHLFSEQEIDVEGGLPVGKEFNPQGRVGVGELPGGKAAVATHIGPYEKLPEAYDAIQKWIADSGRQIAGEPWEVYVTDPGVESDSSNWRTEVFWPIA